MFGAGSIVSGRLGDQWGRWIMMVIFFAGKGVSALIIALCSNKWQIGAALTLMGAFASIYHPVGIPMLVQKAKNPGFTIGVNGLAGNMGIAIASGASVYIAQRFGWQTAFILPGVICLACAVAFVLLVPREEEAPAKRKVPKLSAADHAQHPAGRVGRPEDIAALVRFLLSAEAGFITGAHYVVDGGMTRKMIYEE